MRPALGVMATTAVLLCLTAAAELSAAPVVEYQDVELRYRVLEGEGHQARLSSRFLAYRNLELGWQADLRLYERTGPRWVGRHATVGPLWACVAPIGGRAGLRIELHPWLAVSTSLRELPGGIPRSLVHVKLPFGADVSMRLHGSLSLGSGVRI